MSKVLAWLATTKFGRAVAALAGLFVAFGAVALTMFEKGKRKQAAVDSAKEAQSSADVAEQTVKAARARAEVENEVAKQPSAPPQQVADAAPDTAAGKLRDDGWVH